MFLVRNFFALLITASSMICFVLLLIPKFQTSAYRPFRGKMFVVLGLSAALPYAFAAYVGDSPDLADFRSRYILIGGAIYIFGTYFFVTNFPEKQHPCTFDCCGASHQIFHVCVLIASLVHFYGSLDIFKRRHEVECPISMPSSL